MGVFLQILAAKAESAGRKVIAVDPHNTSRTCPEYGHTAKENRPAQEKFHCVSCGHQDHADTVGAFDVLRAGLVRRDANPAYREAPGFSRGRSHGSELDPFVTATPERGRAAVLVGCAFVSAAEDEDVHQAVEDDLVRDPRVATVQGMTVLMLWQQGEELVADGLEQA